MENRQELIRDYLSQNKSTIAEDVVALMYARNPVYRERFGPEGKKLSLRDAGYHLPFLAEAISSGNPEIFNDYVVWVKLLFRGLNLEDIVTEETLEATGEILRKHLETELSALTDQYIGYALDTLKKSVETDASYIRKGQPLYELAKAYNEALLQGDRREAGQLIMDAVSRGTEIRDIYMHVFQISQYEVGRLWLSNKITVAKEHYCSAATQQIMSTLYPYIFTSERIHQTFVGASIGGELHEIGIRMVADFFEMNGWDTVYLGANTPANALLEAIEEHHPHVLGLSIAMPYHRSMLKDTIHQLRRSELAAEIKILIGGNALNRHQGNLEEFRADGYAPDALQAVALAKKLTAA